MFHAYENSEDDEGMEALRALFDQPGLHSYPFIEIPLNTHLFHLDIAPLSDESRWQRFIFDNLKHIFDFILIEEIKEYRLHIQTRRNTDRDYELKRVVEISEGRAHTGEKAYVFSCANGSIEISGFNDLKLIDIVTMSRIWKEPAP